VSSLKVEASNNYDSIFAEGDACLSVGAPDQHDPNTASASGAEEPRVCWRWCATGLVEAGSWIFVLLALHRISPCLIATLFSEEGFLVDQV
jgi:hypothetical protein